MTIDICSYRTTTFHNVLLNKLVEELSSLPIDHPLKSADELGNLSASQNERKLMYLNNKFLSELNLVVETFFNLFLSPKKGLKEDVSPAKSLRLVDCTWVPTADQTNEVAVKLFVECFYEIVADCCNLGKSYCQREIALHYGRVGTKIF
jgi:hypothetical protein